MLMRSRTRKGLVLVSVFTFAAGMTLVSNAATWNYYSGYVQKTQDLVTSQQKKETTGSATNWAEYVEDNRKLTLGETMDYFFSELKRGLCGRRMLFSMAVR